MGSTGGARSGLLTRPSAFSSALNRLQAGTRAAYAGSSTSAGDERIAVQVVDQAFAVEIATHDADADDQVALDQQPGTCDDRQAGIRQRRGAFPHEEACRASDANGVAGLRPRR